MILQIPNTLRGPAWYLHRLLSKPLEELPFRIGEQVLRALGRRRPPYAFARPVAGRAHTGLADLVSQWSNERAKALTAEPGFALEAPACPRICAPSITVRGSSESSCQ
jgi:hypothetical protein